MQIPTFSLHTVTVACRFTDLCSYTINLYIESNSILLNSRAHILCDNRNNISLNLNIEFTMAWVAAAAAVAAVEIMFQEYSEWRGVERMPK